MEIASETAAGSDVVEMSRVTERTPEGEDPGFPFP